MHIKLIGDLPVGSGVLAEARKAAGYLRKYIAKGLDDECHRAGLHCYEVAQGFQLREWFGRSPRSGLFSEVLNRLADALGERRPRHGADQALQKP